MIHSAIYRAEQQFYYAYIGVSIMKTGWTVHSV